MVFLRVWQPKRSGDLKTSASKMRQRWNATKWPSTTQPVRPPRLGLPFAILSVLVLLWGLPSVKLAMNKATTPAFKGDYA